MDTFPPFWIVIVSVLGILVGLLILSIWLLHRCVA